MKLALLSDIHANLQAFDACLAHAQAVGAQRYALLGDLVGYGADPVAVVQRVIQMAGEGAIVLKGNHDEMAVNEMIDNEAHRRLVNDEWNANVTKVSSRALWVDYTHALATENYIERKNQEKRQNIEQLTSQLVALIVQNANRILGQK